MLDGIREHFLAGQKVVARYDEFLYEAILREVKEPNPSDLEVYQSDRQDQSANEVHCSVRAQYWY